MKFNQTVKKYNLINENDKIIIGLSGGADSTVLVLALFEYKKQYNIEFLCVYIDHMLRDTKVDIKICTDLCEKVDCKLIIKNIDIQTLSQENKMSIEECGRFYRYKIFNEVATEYGYNKIAVGHNLNDNTETFIFNLIRGTTLDGLKGILPQNNNIIRPLLETTKEEIIDFVNANNIAFATDFTNESNIYARNIIRNNILPFMQEINSNAIININNCINNIKEETDFLQNLAIQAYNQAKLDNNLSCTILSKFEKVISLRVIKMFLQDNMPLKDLNAYHYNACLSLVDKISGASVSLPNNFICKKEYDNLIITKHSTENKTIIFGLNELIVFNNFNVSISKNELDNSNFKNYNCIFKTEFYWKEASTFTIRIKLDGDKICFKFGHKKLKNLFLDKKITNRDQIPVISSSDELNEVVCVLLDKIIFSEKYYQEIFVLQLWSHI